MEKKYVKAATESESVKRVVDPGRRKRKGCGCGKRRKRKTS
jgi:hypothetical protein